MVPRNDKITSSMRLVETGDAAQDTYYYKSEFSSLSDLVAAKIDLATQISGEGTVLLKNENQALPMDPASEPVTVWGHNSLFPARGGMIGSTAAAADGQENADIMGALGSRGFQLNQDMIGLYASDEAFAYTRTTFFPGAGLVPSFEATWEQPAVYMVGEIPASMYTDQLLASTDGTAAARGAEHPLRGSAGSRPDVPYDRRRFHGQGRHPGCGGRTEGRGLLSVQQGLSGKSGFCGRCFRL